MSEPSKHQLQTLAVHAGYSPSAEASKDVASPLHLSTTFVRYPDGTSSEYIYTRSNNPNREIVETKLAALEGAQTAITFASGLAAIHALLDSVLEPGSHLIIPDDCYHGTRAIVQQILSRWQVAHTAVNLADPQLLAAAIRPNTRLVWIETPSNPLLKIADIQQLTTLCRQHQILTACDNTFATCILQKPLELGADFVMHSTTKFFSGHSDLLGGVLLTNRDDELTTRLREFQSTAGAVPAPFDCWLLNRSLATFPLRVMQQCANAVSLAAYLHQHPRIEQVFYPGLPDHPNHAVAAHQMQGGYGSLISVLVKGGQTAAMHFAGRLQLFKHATSLGGVESLIEHRRSVEGPHPVSPDNLLRISVGIEHEDDLIRDIAQALRD